MRVAPHLQGGRTAGFTMVELLVTLAVLLILAVVAIPNLNNYTANQEIKGTAQSLYSTLLYARAEAIKRNALVYVYPNGGTTGDWGNGWLVSTDKDTKTADCSSAADEANVLQAHCSIVNTSIQFAGGPPAGIEFHPSGRTQPPSAQLVLCDSNGSHIQPRTVRIELGGLPLIEQGGNCP